LPERDRDVASRFKEFVRVWVKKNLRPLGPECDVSFDTWLEASSYTRYKKQSLRELYNRTVALGDDDFNPYNNFCKCFIKDEAYASFKTPRGIFARKDEFKLRVGPIFKRIEEELTKIDHFIKKIPVNERAAYIYSRFGDISACLGRIDENLMRCMATDYTAYESSFSKEVMNDCEMILYDYMTCQIPEGKQFMRLIRHVLQGTNDCRFARVRARLQAGRMSGEMNTSLGNGFTNLMLFLFAMEEFGCVDYDCLVEGDDGIGVYVGPQIPDSFYAQLGFTMKVSYHLTLNTASFCGQIFDFETLTVITDPMKVLLNFSWVNIKYFAMSNKVRMGLIRSKALCLIYQYPGCPILQAFAQRMLTLSEGFSPVIESTSDSWKMQIVAQAIKNHCPVRLVSMSSRELMQQVFGISILDQVILENYFLTFRDVQPIEHPILSSYFKIDWIIYDLAYTSDRFGPHIVPYRGQGAISESLRSLINVLQAEN